MKLLKKVSTLEAKRCFVLSQRFTSKKMRKKGIKVHDPSEKNLVDHLSQVRKDVLKLKESSLDRIIGSESKKRLQVYNNLDWYVGEVNTSEVKVWKNTGGLHASWTQRQSLKYTAEKLVQELQKENSKLRRKRVMHTVPQIMKVKKIIQKEKYLLPIVVPNRTYAKYSGGFRSIPGILDDGCMRSLAYAVSGDQKIKVYIGIVPEGA